MVPQVADDECGHGGLAAPAVTQVDDECISAGQQGHRGGDALPADCGREQDRLQVEVADVACQALDAGDADAGQARPAGHGGVLLGVVAGRPLRQCLLVVEQPQVLVAVDRLQVGGDRRGQRPRVCGIPSFGQPLGQHPRHRRSHVREDVLCLDQRAHLADDPGHIRFIHSVKKSIRLTRRQELLTLFSWMTTMPPS